MNTIINSIRLYRGTGIPGMTGRRVVVLAVYRGGDDVLRDDSQISRLVHADRLEVAAIITEPDGTERASWSTADAGPDELGPVLGVWAKTIETGLLLQHEGGIDGIEQRN